jgi:hypothetical protein
MTEGTARLRRSAPSFRPDQIEAMHRAFEQVRTRMQLTGTKAFPIVELVAIRIIELAGDGEFDPERLTEATMSTFER